MDIKHLFPNKKKEPQELLNPHRNIKTPWVIEQISNGLKARNVKVIGGIVVASNKKVPVHYFEYDRIFGRAAFSSEGYLRVMGMFDELSEVTPKSIGYIFKDSIFLRYSKGILKRNNKTGTEDFYSEESLRNENLANYLQLDCNQDSSYDQEEDPDREDLHNSCVQLERSTD